MRLLRTLLFHTVHALWTALIAASIVLGVFITRRPDWVHHVGRLWGRASLLLGGARLEVLGLEALDPRETYIFAANHQSAFDIYALYAVLPVRFRWLAKAELFSIPVFGAAMRALGHIPIHRDDPRKALKSIEAAAARVAAGASVIIFPEGTRSGDGVLQDFKKGGFTLALRSGKPVLPVSISGSSRVLPKKGLLRPGPIRVTFGEPVPTAGLTARDREALMTRVREGIRAGLSIAEGGLLPGDPGHDAPPALPEKKGTRLT